MKALLILLLALTLNAEICYSLDDEPIYIVKTDTGLLAKTDGYIYELDYVGALIRDDDVVVRRYVNRLNTAEISVYDSYTKGLFLLTYNNRKTFINCKE
jgi:hypothetical protein